MAIYGYHRTSTKEQHLDRGINEITEFCKDNHYKLEKIYTDQQTGKNFSRPRYTVLRDDILREGDTLIITEVDRLGRNKKDTVEELRMLANRGIRVMILEIPTTLQDLSKMDNAMAKMILETVNHMLIELYAAMAQAEVEKKEKRQREGIEQMKARGDPRQERPLLHGSEHGERRPARRTHRREYRSSSDLLLDRERIRFIERTFYQDDPPLRYRG